MDATFNAIRACFAHEATLGLFLVGAVTEGMDAQARVTVRLMEAGKMVDGQGSDTDTIVASARAYVHALNKLLGSGRGRSRWRFRLEGETLHRRGAARHVPPT